MAISAPVVRAPEFNFQFQVNGFNSWLVTEFNWEGETVGISEHAGGGMIAVYPQSTGFTKYGKVVLKYCMPAVGTDRDYFDAWKALESDPATGLAGDPIDYERTFEIYSMTPGGKVFRVDTFNRGMVDDIKHGNRSSTALDKDWLFEVHLRFYTHQYRLI